MKPYYFFACGERLVALFYLTLSLVCLTLLAWLEPRNENRSRSDLADKPLHQDTIHRDQHYVGPPEHVRWKYVDKFKKLQVLDLNAVDSLTLLRVPGISTYLAKRILSFRRRLGGYYTVLQLQEVYGVDSDKFFSLKPWFKIATPPKRYLLSDLEVGELPEHIYLSWEQKKAINKLLGRYGKIRRWSQLMQEPCFTKDDSVRLSQYFVEAK